MASQTGTDTQTDKTNNCKDVEIDIPPSYNDIVMEPSNSTVKAQEVGDGIVIHFKNGKNTQDLHFMIFFLFFSL